jgi:hypothetical protein
VILKVKTIYQQLTLSELSGSIGDLGTLLPLLIGLSKQRSIQLAPALFFGGLSNFVTGFLWDVPMCVQPMKSISAVALSQDLSSGSLTAAGIIVGGMIFVIGITGLIDVVNAIIPIDVVSGLQIGVGLRLAVTGIRMIQDLGWVSGYDCKLLAVFCALLCLYFFREKSDDRDCEVKNEENKNSNEEKNSLVVSTHDQVNDNRTTSKLLHYFTCCFKKNTQHPVGIYLFLLGILFATIILSTTSNENGQYDLPIRFFGAPIAIWAIGDVTKNDWKYGLLEGALPQLPLTTLNSVISVCTLAHILYPEKRRNRPTCDKTTKNTTDAVVSRRDVAISVGLMNLILCPFGSMPNCHGAGGLAGQHRFGARHGASVVFLGLIKMLIAIFVGASAQTLFDAFPDAVLGVMLCIAANELTTTGFMILVQSIENEEESECKAEEDKKSINRKKMKKLRQSAVIAIITAMVIVAGLGTHYGALSGWVAYMVYGDGIPTFISWLRQRKFCIYCKKSKEHKLDENSKSDASSESETDTENQKNCFSSNQIINK